MYGGAAIAIFSYAVWNPIVSIPIAILGGGTLILPAGVDGLTQMFGRRESNNSLRIATGYFLGTGIVLMVYGVLSLSLSQLG